METKRIALMGIPLSIFGFWTGCGSRPSDETAVLQQSSGQPSPNQVPLDPLTIPKFAHALPIPRVFAPTVITQNGQVVRHEVTVSVGQTTVQMLPPGFPNTTVHAYGGQLKIPGLSGSEFGRTVPGPVFDNTRGVPTLVKWRNEIFQPHFFAVDPTLHWANPQAMEPPAPPFQPFPPGYQNAQYPVSHVTHTHGLVVNSEMDGTAEQHFSPFQHRGPTFSTQDYLMPNEQPGTQLFYHDHTMGMTRLGMMAGLTGTAYFIRDPNSPLDDVESPLPTGQFEIPLVFMNRGFFTDGEIAFPRVGLNPGNPYWTVATGANTVTVNGKVWPNLDVERRQYRFRILASDNANVYDFAFDSGMPFTIIGSDGGYLPAPQVVTTFSLGITERADVLVDFSELEPGTQVVLQDAGADPNTIGTLMRFTVLDTPPVSPPALDPELFPSRPALPVDAPTKFKTMQVIRDAGGNIQVTLDGLEFTNPISEYSTVGSTEQWDLIQLAGINHQIHLHLIEFQVLERQPLDAAAYSTQWQLINGNRPVTRPIVVDPTPFFTGPPQPPPPYDTGWKDTVRAPGNMVTRIRARWAPQEVPTGGVSPGQNLFPIDPTTGPGFIWHCHIVGHEDNDMMRRLPIVKTWAPGSQYVVGSDQVGTVVTYQNVNYKVRAPHTAQASQPPNTRFDLWQRVNNNDGSWAPQIIYAVHDRVLHQGQLYEAMAVHQAQTGQPPNTQPSLWDPLPLTACGQLADFCADDTGVQVGADCLATGQAGDENTCRAQLGTCLPVCLQHVHSSPCSGLCSNPVSFTVPDNQSFQSGPLGTGTTCHETTSELLSGTCWEFAGGRKLTVNGNPMACGSGNWSYPLPPQRNHGYCIQTTAGNQPWAGFSAW